MPPSLAVLSRFQTRLTVWVSAVLLIAIAIAFVIVYDQTGSDLRAELQRNVRGDAAELAQTLRELHPQTADGVLAAARGYAGAQPYSQASALLFVIIPGTGTASNHPELFGASRPDDGETPAQQAEENALGGRLRTPDQGFSTRQIPDVGRVRLDEMKIATASGIAFVGAGEPLDTVTQAQAGVAKSFLLAGGIALAIALLASYIAGARISAPLRRLATLVARVDAGDLEHHVEVNGRASTEVRVLADAFNHMLDRLNEAFAAQRAFVADASHELRTPLTVMRGQLELLALESDPDIEEIRRVESLLQAEISRIARIVEDLLLLAQSERTEFLRPRPVELTSFVEELWDGMMVTAERDFELGELPTATLRADPDRLAQALRNLIRNAIEHTQGPDGVVRLDVSLRSGDSVRFAVSDDGPGIPETERTHVFERFHRTDKGRSRAAGGAGLGLAIVKAIADAHQGSVWVSKSEAGGAMLELEIPGAVPEAATGRVRRPTTASSSG